jgi:DNA-binding LytR/AlgR family response regulator
MTTARMDVGTTAVAYHTAKRLVATLPVEIDTLTVLMKQTDHQWLSKNLADLRATLKRAEQIANNLRVGL